LRTGMAVMMRKGIIPEQVSMTNPVIMWDRSLHRNLWMRHLMSRETVQEMKVPQMTRVLKLQKMEKVIHHMTTETQMIQMVFRFSWVTLNASTYAMSSVFVVL
jgi:hypothetical protein